MEFINVNLIHFKMRKLIEKLYNSDELHHFKNHDK